MTKYISIACLILLLGPIVVTAQGSDYVVTNSVYQAEELLQSSTNDSTKQKVTLLLQIIKLLQLQLAQLSGVDTNVAFSVDDPMSTVKEKINEIKHETQVFFSVDLTPGMETPDVMRLQKWLNANGFLIALNGPGSIGNETTYYGPATAAAVKRYQEKYRSEILTPVGLNSGSGLFLGSTRAHLNKVNINNNKRVQSVETVKETPTVKNTKDSNIKVSVDVDSNDVETKTTINESTIEQTPVSNSANNTTSEKPVVKETAPTPVVIDYTNKSLQMLEGVDYPKLNTFSKSWEHCSDLYFGGCEFEGLREVRYGNENRWIVKDYFDGFPGWHCHPSTFGTTKQEGDRCEVTTESKLGTLNAPTHTMSMSMPKIDLTKIPFGSAGKPNLEIIPVNDTGVANDIGAFRVPCRFSHMSFNDPIVHPGQPGRAHLHAFFGNTNVNAYSTASSLFSNGNSTCPGGIANRSAYWIPALIDTTTNTPLVPTESIWYYKTGYRGVKPNEVKIIPDGLKIVTGDASGDATGEYFWQCTNGAQYSKRGKYIPDCQSGETLQVSVFFPQCWDGVNLDSADHQSHMAYANNGCPNSHPVALPELSLNIGFTVNSGDDTTKWRLSSDMNNMKAGHSTHADFFEAWNKDVKEKFTKNCLNQSKDCHAYLLGDGTRLGDE